MKRVSLRRFFVVAVLAMAGVGMTATVTPVSAAEEQFKQVELSDKMIQGFISAQKDMAELAQKNSCMACHGIDKKIVGPAYKDVAKKYKGNADAVAMLSKKIKDGSTGVWGPIPMPPNGPKVSDADIKVLAEWIMASN